jgi:aspartyl-tRNA synthetase
VTRTPAFRTHSAGSLRAGDVGQIVTLAGWVARRRDHGGVTFIDLRDASGIVQVVIRDEASAHSLRNEFCLKVVGEVVKRSDGNVNPNLATGEIEVTVSGGPAEVPLPRPASPRPRRRDPAAQQGQQGRPRRARPARLRRGGDPDPDPQHSGGGP